MNPRDVVVILALVAAGGASVAAIVDEVDGCPLLQDWTSGLDSRPEHVVARVLQAMQQSDQLSYVHCEALGNDGGCRCMLLLTGPQAARAKGDDAIGDSIGSLGTVVDEPQSVVIAGGAQPEAFSGRDAIGGKVMRIEPMSGDAVLVFNPALNQCGALLEGGGDRHGEGRCE